MKKAIICLVLGSLVLVPQSVRSTADPAEYTEDSLTNIFYKATVVEIQNTEKRTEYGQELTKQDVVVSLSEQPKDLTIFYETNNNHKGRELKEGDRVIVSKTVIGDQETYYISDVYRLNAVIWVGVLFLLLTILIIGKRGWFALLGLVISFLVIVYYLVPQVLGGAEPVITAFIAALLVATVSLFVAHGINLRTTVAFCSTVITIGLSLFLSQIVVASTRLSGLGTEEAFFIQNIAGGETIDLRGLLLGGILIGTLGVLDDITTAQSAAVEEIHRANNTLSFGELYKRGLSVGREHIISLVNTLVLAYTGAALPLILLFTVYPQPIWVTLNSEIVMEEVIRMLVGSIALVVSVPITTLFAAYMFSSKGSAIVQKFHWLPFFRSCNDAHPCVHHHKK